MKLERQLNFHQQWCPEIKHTLINTCAAIDVAVYLRFFVRGIFFGKADIYHLTIHTSPRLFAHPLRTKLTLRRWFCRLNKWGLDVG